MKIIHWSLTNGSGMHRMAENEANSEKTLGIDSIIINPNTAFDVKLTDGVDCHVIHTHLPDTYLFDNKPKIWVSHGTPEVMIEKSYEEAVANGKYGHSDSVMLMQFWLQNSDAVITHWKRHQTILKQLSDKNTVIDYVPMGIDTDYWQPATSAGKYTGNPSAFTAENQYRIKWNLDLYFAWPLVVANENLHGARLHCIYVPRDQHRIWFPLLNRSRCSFFSYISDKVFDNYNLRNAFCSTDYYFNLVRYGDYDMTGLQAAASGAKVISYKGNPYAHYWITEGSHIEMAIEITDILTGNTKPREVLPVDTIKSMTDGYINIYKRLGVS